MIDKTFWNGKRVFITGHTGFKGSWLCLWLHSLGAQLYGYALLPPTNPSLFKLCNIDQIVQSTVADVRDLHTLNNAFLSVQPEIVFHMAAQPLVRDSYKLPVETFEINVMGTVNLLQAVKDCKSVKAAINITSDKCYENKEWVWGYRETEPLGGFDPYSSSKACAEMVTSAYRNSYFNADDYPACRVAVASARAGNVIGGGDWATDRLIPDCVRAILQSKKIIIRNPHAIRPWQHVLEPLSGYLTLAQKLYEDGSRYAEAWNFGPYDEDIKSVEWLVKRLCASWGDGASYIIEKGKHLYEAQHLKLDCSKAKSKLGWRPRWNLEKAIDAIEEWTRAYKEGKNVELVCVKQIEEYNSMQA